MRDVTSDLVARLLIYRGLILREHPRKHVTQHVVVLGNGRLRGYDDLSGQGFALDLRVTYLREVSASVFLAEPGLAPLAALACGSNGERQLAFAAGLRLIHERGGQRSRELLEFAAVLATIRLDRHTINKIVKEIGMTVESIAAEFYDTEFGQELVRMGRVEGRNEARVEARVEMLTALLTERFGDHPDLPATARRLADWPGGAAVHAVTSATTWEDIPAEPPPS